MLVRFFFLLACLLATNFLSATNNFIPNSKNSSILSCELLPPADFHVLEQGPSLITFAWTPIYDGAKHRILTYRASDNTLLDETIVPAGMTQATVKNLPNSTPLNVTINTICEDGSNGPVSLALPTITLILDLIVAGFTPGNEPSCTIPNTTVRCEFDASLNPTDPIKTPFRVYNGSYSRHFSVSYVGDQKYEIRLGTNGNSGQPFKFHCDQISSMSSPDCSAYVKILVMFTDPGSGFEVPAAEFILTRNPVSTIGYFQCISLSPGFRFDRMGPGPVGGGGRASDSENDFLHQMPTASPNPFSNTLGIFPNNPAAESITLQMYNLSGQKVLDQHFAGGQEQYSLSTEGLAIGFYLLRIEADGEVQTLKVVKSE